MPGENSEIIERLKEQFKQAIAAGNVDVGHLGADPESIAGVMTDASTENFTARVLAGGGSEEDAVAQDQVIAELATQIFESADEETRAAMAELTADEFEDILESVLTG
jgi:hypothetical protein